VGGEPTFAQARMNGKAAPIPDLHTPRPGQAQRFRARSSICRDSRKLRPRV